MPFCRQPRAERVDLQSRRSPRHMMDIATPTNVVLVITEESRRLDEATDHLITPQNTTGWDGASWRAVQDVDGTHVHALPEVTPRVAAHAFVHWISIFPLRSVRHPAFLPCKSGGQGDGATCGEATSTAWVTGPMGQGSQRTPTPSIPPPESIQNKAFFVACQSRPRSICELLRRPSVASHSSFQKRARHQIGVSVQGGRPDWSFQSSTTASRLTNG